MTNNDLIVIADETSNCKEAVQLLHSSDIIKACCKIGKRCDVGITIIVTTEAKDE